MQTDQTHACVFPMYPARQKPNLSLPVREKKKKNYSCIFMCVVFTALPMTFCIWTWLTKQCPLHQNLCWLLFFLVWIPAKQTLNSPTQLQEPGVLDSNLRAQRARECYLRWLHRRLHRAVPTGTAPAVYGWRARVQQEQSCSCFWEILC